MKINKDRESLETEVKSLISLFATTVDKKEFDLIVEHLNSKHGIKKSNVYMLLNNSNNVSKLTLEELALFGKQLTVKLGIDNIEWMNTWFTEREIKEFERFQFVDMQSIDDLDFPITLSNVTYLGNGYYNLTITRQLLGRLYKYGKLNYNPNVQRGMRKVYRYGKEMEEPIVFKSKVTEMSKLTLEDKLEPSTITLNAAQMSSDEGEELIYDEKSHKLTINSGTILDIVDGMHRTLATYSAYSKDKDINGSYPITISNKSDEEIQRYQVNMDKQTPLTRSKIVEYSGGHVSNVINILKSKGELKDRISSVGDSKATLRGSDIIPYKMLHAAISNVYNIDSVLQSRKVADEINEYLVYLFGYFGKHERDEYKVLFDADLFEAHLTLASKMKENKIPYDKLSEIIKIEAFNIENKFWKDTNVINNEGKVVNKKMRRKISDFFEGMLEEAEL
ncbi:hypothetical protein FJQ98_16130 [Lysinibacillus agricola]|uniref:Uncharacterized protein n=1 Tax=Lysinibacillus agricola TaxID=2590012 RepID=A0ABX7ARB0_9BACI|nr:MULTISPECIES: hypothetical protein [Lysinibacillus]KOS61529.1 hypothetical protein AN161_18240 [Lysinibacillus sp. FJAT-14222]QQP10774.1 hypothetical protein FJQ98_16130 [Lysinibacillus agricola]